MNSIARLIGIRGIGITSTPGTFYFFFFWFVSCINTHEHKHREQMRVLVSWQPILNSHWVICIRGVCFITGGPHKLLSRQSFKMLQNTRNQDFHSISVRTTWAACFNHWVTQWLSRRPLAPRRDNISPDYIFSNCPSAGASLSHETAAQRLLSVWLTLMLHVWCVKCISPGNTLF